MKATEILKWITEESINGEFLNTVNVPAEGEQPWNQNEMWWLGMFGGMPAGPIEQGEYLYYYRSAIPDKIHTNERGYFEPDEEIELVGDNDYIYLYKL